MCGVFVGIDGDVEQRNLVAATAAIPGGDELAPPSAIPTERTSTASPRTTPRHGRSLVERVLKCGELLVLVVAVDRDLVDRRMALELLLPLQATRHHTDAHPPPIAAPPSPPRPPLPVLDPESLDYVEHPRCVGLTKAGAPCKSPTGPTAARIIRSGQHERSPGHQRGKPAPVTSTGPPRRRPSRR